MQRIFEIVLEIIGWLQLVMAPTLGTGIIALIVYVKINNETGKVIAIIILSLGFLFGVIWATRIWKKHGTIAWLSRIRRIS